MQLITCEPSLIAVTGRVFFAYLMSISVYLLFLFFIFIPPSWLFLYFSLYIFLLITIVFDDLMYRDSGKFQGVPRSMFQILSAALIMNSKKTVGLVLFCYYHQGGV